MLYFCKKFYQSCLISQYVNRYPTSKWSYSMYAAGVQDQYLSEIKEMIARYLLAKAKEEAGLIWQQKRYTAKTAQTWLKGE